MHVTVPVEIRAPGAAKLDGLSSDRISLLDLAEHPHRHWVILGDAGAGKTTSLRRLAIQLLERGTLALYVKASEFLERPLPDILRDYGDRAADQFGVAAGGGLAALLVDGLDEVPRQAAIHRKLAACRHAYPQMTILASSRSIGFQRVPEFVQVEMCPLSWAQQRDLLERVLEPSKGADVERIQLHLASRPRLRELAQNPLVLTLIGKSYNEGRPLPERRVGLYRDAVEFLLTRATDATAPRPFGRIGWSLAADTLGWLVIGLHGDAPDAIETRAFVERGSRAQGAIRAALDQQGGTVAFLTRCSAGAGLLVPDRPSPSDATAWTFSHRTFREYLMASMFVKLRNQDRVIQLALANPALWGETLALATGLMDDPDDFVQRIVAQGRTHSALVHHLLADAEGISESALMGLLELAPGRDHDPHRAKVLRRVDTLIRNPEARLRIAERLLEMVTTDLAGPAVQFNGADLLLLDELLGRLARVSVRRVAARAETQRARLWRDHRPNPRRSLQESLRGERGWHRINKGRDWGVRPEGDLWDDPGTLRVAGRVDVVRPVLLSRPGLSGLLFAEFDGPIGGARAEPAEVTRLRAEAFLKWLGTDYRLPSITEYRAAHRQGLLDREPWLVHDRGGPIRRSLVLVKRAREGSRHEGRG